MSCVPYVAWPSLASPPIGVLIVKDCALIPALGRALSASLPFLFSVADLIRVFIGPRPAFIPFLFLACMGVCLMTFSFGMEGNSLPIASPVLSMYSFVVVGAAGSTPQPLAGTRRTSVSSLSAYALCRRHFPTVSAPLIQVLRFVVEPEQFLAEELLVSILTNFVVKATSPASELGLPEHSPSAYPQHLGSFLDAVPASLGEVRVFKNRSCHGLCIFFPMYHCAKKVNVIPAIAPRQKIVIISPVICFICLCLAAVGKFGSGKRC